MSIIEVHMCGVNERLCPNDVPHDVFSNDDANTICQAAERAFNNTMTAAGFKGDFHARLDFSGSFHDWNGGKFYRSHYDGGKGPQATIAEAVADYLDDDDDDELDAANLTAAIDRAEDAAHTALAAAGEEIAAFYKENK